MPHIAELPDLRAAQNPTGPCVADDHDQLDNQTFLHRVRTAATVLHAHGVGAGDVVAVVLPNRVELVVIMFAAWRLGAAVTPVNPGLTDGEARYQIEDCAAKVVIADGGRALGTLDVGAVGCASMEAEAEDARPHPSDALALIIYTSGTTGRPKGVMLDHANVAAMCQMIIGGLGLDETDHSLLVLPLFHVNGIVVSVLSPLLAGGRATVAARFQASAFFASVERARPTYVSAVPAIYAMLVSLPGQAVAVMDAEGRLVQDGSPGEVVVRGPNVMRGYLGMPQETAETIVDGWLHTGDVGHFDADGYLVLVDRIKDMIIRGGENLYPKEIENVLHAHPAVLEAAVIGAPHPVLGEVPVAHVALLPDTTATAEQLIEHCRARLARIKVPVSVFVAESLPKNPVGKIDKPRLRALALRS